MAVALPENEDERFEPRQALSIPARLISLDGSYAVRLDDLSRTGARLSRPRSDAVSSGILRWLGFETFGKVIWQEGHACGLKFDKELPEHWILKTIAAAASADEVELRSAASEWVAGS